MTKRKDPVKKLIKAEEEFLRATGWQKAKGSKVFWTPKQTVGYVFPGDRVFRNHALSAQKSELDFPSR